MAPLKAAVFPLVQSKDLDEVARRISTKLDKADLANNVDTTGERAWHEMLQQWLLSA